MKRFEDTWVWVANLTAQIPYTYFFIFRLKYMNFMLYIH